MSEECYKNNLFLLKSIKNSDILAFKENKLFIDDRYFTYLRKPYKFNKIIVILEDSFKDTKDIELVKESIEGLNTLAKNDSYSEDEKIKILNLYNKINKDLSDKESSNKESADNEEDNTNNSNDIDENISNQKTNEYLNYIKDTFIETWYNLRLFFKDTFVYIYGLVKN